MAKKSQEPDALFKRCTADLTELFRQSEEGGDKDNRARVLLLAASLHFADVGVTDALVGYASWAAEQSQKTSKQPTRGKCRGR